MASNRKYNRAQASVTTTDATVTTVITIAVPTGHSIMGRIMAVSRNTANGNTNGFTGIISEKNPSGTASGAGNINSTSLLADDAVGGITLVGSSGNLLIKVTGVAATTYDWEVFVEWIEN